jgi:hypothetical protein
MMSEHKIEVGQVWKDLDRRRDRHVMVDSASDTHAYISDCTATGVPIPRRKGVRALNRASKARFNGKRNGYRFVKDLLEAFAPNYDAAANKPPVIEQAEHVEDCCCIKCVPGEIVSEHPSAETLLQRARRNAVDTRQIIRNGQIIHPTVDLVEFFEAVAAELERQPQPPSSPQFPRDNAGPDGWTISASFLKRVLDVADAQPDPWDLSMEQVEAVLLALEVVTGAAVTKAEPPVVIPPTEATRKYLETMAALSKDAERYRWLRRRIPNTIIIRIDHECEDYRPEKLDELVDARMGAAETKSVRLDIRDGEVKVTPTSVTHCDHGVSLAIPCEQCRRPETPASFDANGSPVVSEGEIAGEKPADPAGSYRDATGELVIPSRASAETNEPLFCCPKYQNLVCNGACKDGDAVSERGSES